LTTNQSKLPDENCRLIPPNPRRRTSAWLCLVPEMESVHWHSNCKACPVTGAGAIFGSRATKPSTGAVMDAKRVAKEKTTDPAANPDPITHAPGAHPVGAGVGAAAGGAAGIGAAMAAGAAAGSAAGPIGTAAGAVVGGVVGGLIGKGVAEKIDPSVEHAYWRENYASRPYVPAGTTYEEVSPAYQTGFEARGQYADKSFDQVEQSLGKNWDRVKGKSRLKWDQARLAARDAWEHADSGSRQSE
jgi:hypothetical protein